MNTETEINKEIVREFTLAINRRNWDRLDELTAPDFIRHSYSAPEVENRDELKSYLKIEFDIFPDAAESIEDIIAEGDKVAVRLKFVGTQKGRLGEFPPSGKIMNVDYMAIYRIENGVIREAWAEWDNLAGLIQLGYYKKI